ncbi:type II secretion system protein [Candidatus Dependentiae bacterium]|nr:type II secretion system protein [Candidatus Dependentiae bacterium]
MNKQNGFGILEAIIVLTIIGFILSGTVGFLMRDKTTQDLFDIQHAVNGLLLSARQEALMSGSIVKLHLYCRETPQKIILEKNIPNPENPREKKTVAISTIGQTSQYNIPSSWKIIAVYAGHEEQLTKNKGHAYCFVPHDGLISPLLIQLQSTEAQKSATLKSEAFQKKFSLHHIIINPPKKSRS